MANPSFIREMEDWLSSGGLDELIEEVPQDSKGDRVRSTIPLTRVIHGGTGSTSKRRKIENTASSPLVADQPQITSEIGTQLKRQLQLKVLVAIRHGYIDTLKDLHKTLPWFRFDFRYSEKVTRKKKTKLKLFTPLIEACKYNQRGIVEWLLKDAGKYYDKKIVAYKPKKKGEKVDQKLVSNSALIAAVSSKELDLEIIRLLLKEGNQSLGLKKKYQVTALHVACSRGYVEVVEMMLQYNRAWLATNKVSPKVFGNDDLKDTNGNTPFMLAVLKNTDRHRKIMGLLLTAEGENIEQIVKMVSKDFNKKKFNSVMMAALGGQLQCLELMEQFGAISDDISTHKTKNGWNIIHCAVASGSLETLDWLLTVKSVSLLRTDILDAQNEKGYTPFLLACEYQSTEIAKYLVELSMRRENGIELRINAKTNDGKTALHLAAMHNTVHIVDLLLQHPSVDPFAVEAKFGNSVLHVATSKYSVDVEARLKEEKQVYNELSLILNKERKNAEGVRMKVHIPKEIENRGEKAKEAYLKAIREGTTKNTQCNLIVLGEGRVGKTSLIKNILGRDFDPNCKPTQGVQLNLIETVAERLDIVLTSDDSTQWKTSDPMDRASDHFAESVVNAVNKADPLQESESDTEHQVASISSEDLGDEIDSIVRQLEPHLNWESSITQPKKPTTNALKSKPARRAIGPYRPLIDHQKRKDTQQSSRSTATNSAQKRSTAAVPNHPQQIQGHSEVGNHNMPPTNKPSRRVTPPAGAVIPLPPESFTFSDTKHIGKKMRQKAAGKNTQHKFVFHTIDFAGQSLYRPMHHCFITHRAVYIVVFKLTDVLKYIREVRLDKDPVSEIQYWLNNVLAHSSVSHNAEKPRIFLVGTHKNGDKGGRNPLSESDLEDVNDKLMEVFFVSDNADTRFRDTIQFTSKRGGNIVFSVENSDGEDEGVKLLKNRINELKANISFLNEDIPTSYIRLEKKLLEMQKERESQPLTTTQREVEGWARDCGIAEPNAAIQFYHDIRVIVDQGLISSPFQCISEADRLDGDRLVLLSPQWLGDMMCKIVELRIGNEGFDMERMISFQKTGVLLCSDLHKCLVGNVECVEGFSNLLKVFELYCLIFPVRKTLMQSTLLQLAAPAHHDDQFLIPCRMPKMKANQHSFQSTCYKFEFSFQSYLPHEVFVHCLCFMLSNAEFSCQYDEKKHRISLSDTCLTLTSVKLATPVQYIADWKMEINKKRQALVFSICPREKDIYQDSPHKYIVDVDESIINVVCQNGSLGCLSYKGGPRTHCTCVGDQETVLLPFVNSDKESPNSSECFCECTHRKHDVNGILKLQMQPEQSTAAPPTVQNLVTFISGTGSHDYGINPTGAGPHVVSPPSPSHDHSHQPPSGASIGNHPILQGISHPLIVRIAEVFHSDGKRIARYLDMKEQWKEITRRPHSEDSDEEDIEIDNVTELIKTWVQAKQAADGSYMVDVKSVLKESLENIDKGKAAKIFL